MSHPRLVASRDPSIPVYGSEAGHLAETRDRVPLPRRRQPSGHYPSPRRSAVCYCRCKQRRGSMITAVGRAHGREPVPVVVNQVFGRFLPADRRLNPTALAWIVVVIAAIGMLAVQSSIAAGVYDAPVALAFGLTVIHAGTMPLSMLRPLFGAILS